MITQFAPYCGSVDTQSDLARQPLRREQVIILPRNPPRSAARESAGADKRRLRGMGIRRAGRHWTRPPGLEARKRVAGRGAPGRSARTPHHRQSTEWSRLRSPPMMVPEILRQIKQRTHIGQMAVHRLVGVAGIHESVERNERERTTFHGCSRGSRCSVLPGAIRLSETLTCLREVTSASG